jgi:hypothetical protein
MYVSNDIRTKSPFKANQSSEAGFICIQSDGVFVKLSALEAQQLVVELQRELALVEAAARGVAA